MKCRILFIVWGVAFCTLFAPLNCVFAQGTAFTYQGQLLLNSEAVTGNFDLQFRLRPALSSTNQVGPTLTNSPTGVTNGLFIVTLDFGDVWANNPLYLEIGLRTNGSASAYNILSPTQLITSAPYAVQALQSANFTGAIADSQLSTNIAQLDAEPDLRRHGHLQQRDRRFQRLV